MVIIDKLTDRFNQIKSGTVLVLAGCREYFKLQKVDFILDNVMISVYTSRLNLLGLIGFFVNIVVVVLVCIVDQVLVSLVAVIYWLLFGNWGQSVYVSLFNNIYQWRLIISFSKTLFQVILLLLLKLVFGPAVFNILAVI